MADYNVQMKQFNGTSFDNILPYASQALTLAGGGSATEIIAQARAGLSQFATGSYIGNGQLEFNITVGFKPKIIIVQANGGLNTSSSSGGTSIERSLTSFDKNSYGSMFWAQGLTELMIAYYLIKQKFYKMFQNWTINDTGFNVSLQVSGTAIENKMNPHYICNKSEVPYVWVAFG